MLKMKECKFCGQERLIGIDDCCDACWEVHSRVGCTRPELLAKLIKFTMTPECIKELVGLLGEE